MKQGGGGVQPAVADPLPRHGLHGVGGLVAPRRREGDVHAHRGGKLPFKGRGVGERLGAEGLESEAQSDSR